MSKIRNRDAFYERMRNLANVNEGKSTSTNSLGDLINYERGADGAAYGIVKENHHYYIKKSNASKEPLVEDFAYIGGLGNRLEYRYDKLSEANKNRNMFLLTINEALNAGDNVISENKKSSPQVLSEGKKKVDENAEEEIAAAEEKLASAEEKTEEIPTEPEVEVPVAEPEVDAEIPAEEPLPDAEGAEGLPPEGDEAGLDVDGIDLPPEGDEMPPEGEELPPEGDEMPPEDEETPPEGDTDENNEEVEKLVGKLTNKVRETEMTTNQVKSYVNSVLTSFEDKFPELEVEERKDMADKITKVVDGEQELEDDMGAEEPAMSEEEHVCNECGFAKFAESMGYEDGNALMESDDEEIANLMSGYMMECDGAVPDEDLASMAMISNDAVVESLVNEYGHSGLVESLEPFTKELNEGDANPEAKTKNIEGMFWWKTKPQDKKDTTLKVLSEEDLAMYGEMSDDQLSELDENTLAELNMAGLKNVGGYLKNKTGQAIKGAGSAISNAVSSKIDQATQKLDQIGDEIAQQYQKGVKGTVEQKLQKAAQEFGELVVKLDQASQKAGDGPLNKHQFLMQLQGILKGGQVAEMEGQVDTNYTSVQPELAQDEMPVNENDDEDVNIDDVGSEDNGEVTFAADAEPMGGGLPKPDGAATTTVDVENGSVKVTMSESEVKLRKYIRTRLEEMTGKRKPSLNEGKKSDKIKQLDKLIEKQVKLFESTMGSEEAIDEIFGLNRKSNTEKFNELDSSDVQGIEGVFNDIFRTALKSGARKQAAQRMSPEIKYDLMSQGVGIDDLKNPGFVGNPRTGEYKYKPLTDFGSSDGGSGSTRKW